MPVDASDLRPSGAPVVSVIGEAALRAEPDEAMVLVTLSALEGTPRPALENVARRSDALVALLDELSIDRSDRSTTGVTVQEDFDHTQEGRRSLGHRAASTVAKRLTDLELIGQLDTRATTELGARVDGPRCQIAPRIRSGWRRPGKRRPTGSVRRRHTLSESAPSWERWSDWSNPRCQQCIDAPAG